MINYFLYVLFCLCSYQLCFHHSSKMLLLSCRYPAIRPAAFRVGMFYGVDGDGFVNNFLKVHPASLILLNLFFTQPSDHASKLCPNDLRLNIALALSFAPNPIQNVLAQGVAFGEI